MKYRVKSLSGGRTRRQPPVRIDVVKDTMSATVKLAKKLDELDIAVMMSSYPLRVEWKARVACLRTATLSIHTSSALGTHRVSERKRDRESS